MRHLDLYAVAVGDIGPIADNPALGFDARERRMGGAELTVVLALAWSRAFAADAVLRRSKPHHENRDAFEARVRAVARTSPRSLHELAVKLGEKLGMRGGRWLSDDETLWVRAADAQPGRHVAALLGGTTLPVALTLANVARELVRDLAAAPDSLAGQPGNLSRPALLVSTPPGESA
jgi:hypothetical protein